MIGAHMMYITWVAKIRWPEPWKNGQATKLYITAWEVSFYCLQNNPAGSPTIPGLHLEVRLAKCSIKMLYGNFGLVISCSACLLLVGRCHFSVGSCCCLLTTSIFVFSHYRGSLIVPICQ